MEQIEQILTYVLVFVAVLIVSLIIMSIVQSVTQENLENIRSGSSARNSKFRFDKYISEQRLKQIQLLMSVLSFTGGICVILLAGVELIPVPALVGLATGYIGYKAPVWYFMILDSRRKRKIEEQLFSVIISFHGGIQAGQAVSQSLASAVKRAEEPIKGELQAVLRDYNLGISLPEALERMYQSYQNEDLLLLITSIRLSIQTGGKLSQILKQLVDTIRQRRDFKRKLDALTSQGKFEALLMALAPTAALILMYIVQKNLMVLIFKTYIGWISLIVVHVMELLAYFWIKKIVTIKV